MIYLIKKQARKRAFFGKTKVLNKAKEILYNCNKRKQNKTKQKTRRGIRFSFRKTLKKTLIRTRKIFY